MKQALTKIRVLFIVNPRAGTNRDKRLQHALDRYLDRNRFDPQVVYTQYAGHAAKLAEEGIAGGAQIMVAVGGDGSVNEVMSSIAAHPKVRLAILPWGSGNGLARSLGIPRRLKKNIAVLNSLNVRRLDIGRVNGQLFLSNAGTGFDSRVIADFASSRRRGLWSYLYFIVKTFFRYKALDYEIRTDTATFSGKAFMITAANGIQLGYGFKVAAPARPDDGLLDLVIIRDFPWYALPDIVLRAFLGTLHRSSYVNAFQTRQLTIHREGMRAYQYDGETGICEGMLRIDLLPLALRIIAPPGRSGRDRPGQ